MTQSKPRFKRQESWRYKRITEAWRRPRGVTSRMRKEKAGWPQKVKVGHGSSHETRGLHPRGLAERLVKHVSDLDGLKPEKHIVRLSQNLGERKRLMLVDRAKTLNLHIANPGKEEARPAEESEEKTGRKARPAEEVREVEQTEDMAKSSGTEEAEPVSVEQETGNVELEETSPEEDKP